jgi:hypothetical protein
MKAVMLHPIGYDERPRTHEPDHFQHIYDTMMKRGHVMLPEYRISEADVLLFNSDVWHIDAAKHTSPYNQNVLGVVLRQRIPVVWFDHFDHSGSDVAQGRWPGTEDWSDQLRNPDGDWSAFGHAMSRPGVCRILYFMRKMQIHQAYPDYVKPLEYPIFEDYPLVSKEELCARPYDVCGLANEGAIRKKAMEGLRNSEGRIRADCQIVLHFNRLGHDAWLERHRQAKFFVEADTSLGSERPMRLITVAAMLRIRSDHRLPFPREDMVHHVVVGDYDGNIRPHDIDKIVAVTSNPDLLYSIYVQGAEHMRKCYSLDARSKYVIDEVERFIR